LAAGDLCNLVGGTVTMLTRYILLSINGRLFNVAGDVESVPRCLGDGKAVVQGEAGWDNTDSDKGTPHLVDSNLAVASAGVVARRAGEGVLEASNEAKHDEGSSKLPKTLHGKDGTHHGTTPLGGSELGGDDGGERVVTTDTDAHEYTPEDDQTDDGSSRAGTDKRLCESRNDDEDQLKTIHLLTSDDISKGAETELSNDSACRGCKLDRSILLSGEGSLVVVLVDDTQHDGQKGHAEDVVTVREETSTGDQDGANVVPAKGSLVDLRESEASSLIGVLDMCEVIVEVVETTAR
jgi:hypothetical protein